MKLLNTFFQTCVYFCILIVVFTLAVNVISSWSLFVSVEAGSAASGESDNVFSLLTGLSGGMEFIWLSLLTVGGIASIVVAKITFSTNIIGVWLLSSVLWSSYMRMFSVVEINNWIPLNVIVLFTTVLLFVWVSAIIGMLSGSG